MRRVVLGLGLAACLALAASPQPRLLWNTTASVPVGFYGLSAPGRLEIGQLVVVRPDPAIAADLADGGWLPAGVPLIKPVAAIAGQAVCRQGLVVLIDGRMAARARPADDHGRSLPDWQGCRLLEPGELFLLSDAPGSLDGRYFGVTAPHQVLARARPLWISRAQARR